MERLPKNNHKDRCFMGCRKMVENTRCRKSSHQTLKDHTNYPQITNVLLVHFKGVRE